LAGNDDIVPTGKVLYCPRCNKSLGKVVLVNGCQHLLVNDFLVRDGAHVCPASHKRFYFYGSTEDRKAAEEKLPIA